MYITYLVTFFKDDMFTLLKFIFKVVLTVQVFHWTLAEANLFLPGIKDYALEKLESYQIPTHDVFLAKGISSFGDAGQRIDQMIANFPESPLKANFPDSIFRPSDMKFSDLKYVALNQLPVNPVKVFENKALIGALNGHNPNPWQEF